MQYDPVTARACSNIALIKYWGNRDDRLRLPTNGSISMNLAGLETTTSLRFDDELPADRLTLNGSPAAPEQVNRVSQHLDLLRGLARTDVRAYVESYNSFPTGAGIASSASAFAALTVAAAAALGLELTERELSALARRGSGSACRSIPGGFAEWYPGAADQDSYAETIATPDHWDLIDLVAIVSTGHKAVGSTGGHAIAGTSPLQSARVADAAHRLDLCRAALLDRDFEALATVMELDALMMHAVMMTSNPPLIYWEPPTLTVIEAVRSMRAGGVHVAFTIDAGANVHVLAPGAVREKVETALRHLPGVSEVLFAPPGEKAIVIAPGANG